MKLTEPRTWFRQVIPAGYCSATLTLDGCSPLLMNSAETDPESEIALAFEQLAATRKKTQEIKSQLRRMEWKMRIYLDSEIGPYIPGKNIKEMLRSAATKWRLGQEVQRSLIVNDYRVPLLYDGPRDEEGLWAGGFRYTSMVANAGAGSGRVQRCRPMFPQWSLSTELAFDPEALDFHKIEEIAEYSRRFGLGDYRPLFGAFLPTVKLSETVKDAPRGNAAKKRNKTEAEATQAFVERIKEFN